MLWGLESGEGEEETDFEEDEPVGTFNGAARSVFRFHYNIRAPDASEVSKPWHLKSLKDLGWTVPPKADLVFVPHFSAGGEDWRAGIEEF